MLLPRTEFIKAEFLLFIVLTICGIILPYTVNAQNIVTEENRWNVLGMGVPGYMGTETYIIDGDSIVGNYNYKIIWMTFDSIDASWTYQGLLREDSNIVYYVPPGETEGVLYDFNLNVGDTTYIINMFCVNEEIPVVIIDIDTAEYFGIQRKRWLLDGDYGLTEYWIEGIGSNLGILQSKYYMCIVCPSWELLCFHKNNELLFSLNQSNECYIVNIDEGTDIEKQIGIFPNPARDKFEVRSEEFGVEKVAVFDLQGRKLIDVHFADGTKNAEILVSELLPGTYICRISIENHEIVRKILIQ